jgi:hypothetical protein
MDLGLDCQSDGSFGSCAADGITTVFKIRASSNSIGSSTPKLLSLRRRRPGGGMSESSALRFLFSALHRDDLFLPPPECRVIAPCFLGVSFVVEKPGAFCWLTD